MRISPSGIGIWRQCVSEIQTTVTGIWLSFGGVTCLVEYRYRAEEMIGDFQNCSHFDGGSRCKMECKLAVLWLNMMIEKFSFGKKKVLSLDSIGNLMS